VEQLLAMKGWTNYELSKKTDIPQSAMSSWKNKGFVPTVVTIEKICAALEITLAQFFTTDAEVPGLTPEEAEFLDKWRNLSYEEKQILRKLLEK
jgi:transcriptional regulator with XRE-family HTH domain